MRTGDRVASRALPHLAVADLARLRLSSSGHLCALLGWRPALGYSPQIQDMGTIRRAVAELLVMDCASYLAHAGIVVRSRPRMGLAKR
jgi:hypothetical protein